MSTASSTELDKYLERAYKASIKPQAIALNKIRQEMKTAMEANENLKQAATKRLSELKALFISRGERACYVSSVYRKFLEETVNG